MTKNAASKTLLHVRIHKELDPKPEVVQYSISRWKALCQQHQAMYQRQGKFLKPRHVLNSRHVYYLCVHVTEPLFKNYTPFKNIDI